MAAWIQTVPLTKIQTAVARLLSSNRTEDSHLAGGAALHLAPNSTRYSNDLDYFNDSEERVASAFESDRSSLESGGFSVEVVLNQPGYIRAVVRGDRGATKVEWAHDSAWRFLPAVKDEDVGFRLHPMDLAVNKVLALAGRDAPRDLLDVIHVHETVLPLGALVWAAAGKDPGFTPRAILDLIRRRGKIRPEDIERLHLATPVDLHDIKQRWLDALSEAERFVSDRPPDEVGCLYYSMSRETFVGGDVVNTADVRLHYGRPGGVLPTIRE